MDRRSITIRGVVQGVGFRPFVYELAVRLGLNGSVMNRAGEVRIEVEGELAALDRFLSELRSTPPPLSRIDSVTVEARRAEPSGSAGFQIVPSLPACEGSIFVAPDTATCEDCLRELFDPHDRRYRYPFLNCTNCGPRLTIIRGAPYDRERTTMAGFSMCASCRAEYEDPGDRRYHAQPIACPDCGPALGLRDGSGAPISVSDPLAYAIEAIRSGRIVAIKGLGGYHLACNASDERAVSELRRRKHREEKPFAVMLRAVAEAGRYCEIEPAERDLLDSPRRPIVLLTRRPGAQIGESVAPGNPLLGIMLPYTPLHHLLLSDLGGLPLVMTSGNRSDEPIAYEDSDALTRLSGIADCFLIHDRPIHLRCDDSVTRIVAGIELPYRRSRGDAPLPLNLPLTCRRPTLAVGGQLKSVFALGIGSHGFLSHHLGDLDHFEAYRAFESAIDHYQRLFAFRPRLVAHDLHPDYASSRYARALVPGIETVAIQHHHAHMASCMTENGLNEPVIGVLFDGTGYGTDGAIWGGEFLTGDYRGFQRAAYLRYVRMPGGEQAIHEPWRMAAAYLRDAEIDPDLLRDRVPLASLRLVTRMVERALNAPFTSSMGRLFDGVAVLAGLSGRVSFEGQAAMQLEAAALEYGASEPFSFRIDEESGTGGSLLVDTRPMVVEIVAQAVRRGDAGAIARRFHDTVIEIVSTTCGRIRERTGLGVVVLSGGVFLNALLTREVVARLDAEGFRVYRHQKVPPGDGGLSLGQLAIAAATDRRE